MKIWTKFDGKFPVTKCTISADHKTIKITA